MTDRREPDAVLEESEVLQYLDTLSNWGRWGEDDQGGTLNLLTAERTARAAALVRSGTTVSCSRMLAPRPSRWIGYEYLHRMNSSGEAAPEHGPGGASDWFGISFHGFEHTHMDAHSHIFWDGKMYNGRSSKLCTTERGALAGGVEPAVKGIVGRGLLVDGPAILQKPYMAPGDGLTVSHLDEWFRSRDTQVEAGDLLWVRTGRDVAESSGNEYDQYADGSPCLTAECLPWLREHDISVLLSDVANDVRPSPYEQVSSPIHQVGIVAMGLWLIDNAQMGPLAEQCEEASTIEFMSVIVPLALRRTTGSPVNPIAVF